MIEIKVSTVKDYETKQEIRVEARSKHSGTYGGFVREMQAVIGALDKTDHEVFSDALGRYLVDKIDDILNESDDSEGVSDDE